MIMTKIRIKTFEGNPLPVGGDDAGLLENVGGGASDLVPVPGQVLDNYPYDYDDLDNVNILMIMVMVVLRIWFQSQVRSLMVTVMMMIRARIVIMMLTRMGF